MAKLINGNGNPAVYAAEDADMLAGIMGNVTTITAVGNEFAATASGANLIEVADGVILTQEGRRIQLDAGLTDAFTIPSGTAGTTNYYIIGYRLYESTSGTQECETFVQLMASSTDTIPEETFRGGATEVFVSLYRVEQDGVNLGTITSLLPKVSGVSQINEDLSKKSLVNTYYDSSAKKLYMVNADGTKGAEIPMGGKMLNLAGKHEITNTSYTTTKDGVLMGSIFSGSGTMTVSINGSVFYFQSGNLAGENSIWADGIPSGTSIVLSKANGTNAKLYFVPYAS